MWEALKTGTFLVKVDIWVLCRVGIWAVNAPQGTTQHGPGIVGPDHCNLWSLWFNKAKKSHLQNSFYSNIWDSVVCCVFLQSLWFRLWSMLLCKSVVNSCGFSWVQQKSGPGPLSKSEQMTLILILWKSWTLKYSYSRNRATLREIGPPLILLGTIHLPPVNSSVGKTTQRDYSNQEWGIVLL